MTEKRKHTYKDKAKKVKSFTCFYFQEFAGNTDRSSIVKHSLSPDVKARFVRFYPVTHHGYPCLRVEIFVLK